MSTGERTVTYRGRAGDGVADLAGVLGRLDLEPDPSVTVRVTVLDSIDGRIHAAGARLDAVERDDADPSAAVEIVLGGGSGPDVVVPTIGCTAPRRRCAAGAVARRLAKVLEGRVLRTASGGDDHGERGVAHEPRRQGDRGRRVHNTRCRDRRRRADRPALVRADREGGRAGGRPERRRRRARWGRRRRVGGRAGDVVDVAAGLLEIEPSATAPSRRGWPSTRRWRPSTPTAPCSPTSVTRWSRRGTAPPPTSIPSTSTTSGWPCGAPARCSAREGCGARGCAHRGR